MSKPREEPSGRPDRTIPCPGLRSAMEASERYRGAKALAEALSQPRAKISRTRVQNWVSQGAVPVDQLPRVAKVLGVRPADLTQPPDEDAEMNEALEELRRATERVAELVRRRRGGS